MELGTARAAASKHIPKIVSTMANMDLGTVATSENPNLWFQLYVIKDRGLVESWVRQAEAAGYKAIMVTVDAQRLGKREADQRNRFKLPEGLQLANLQPLAAKASSAAQKGLLQARDTSESGSGLVQLFTKEVDDSLTWEFLPWLKKVTKLPVYVKGVLAPADAQLALEYGADGIVVSNHGGRQLDYSPSALDMLPSVVAAVKGRVPVLMDGGIRRGTDVFKALALGASCVLLGRPVLYGLAVGGQAGVAKVLETIRGEFELAMALAGCRHVWEIQSEHLLKVTGSGLLPVSATCSDAGTGQCCEMPKERQRDACAGRCQAAGLQSEACSCGTCSGTRLVGRPRSRL